jgi:hypothetical protein
MSMSVRRPLVALMALAAALALMVPLLAGRAGAADSSVTVVHGIPGVTVDVYVAGNLTLPGFAPGTVTDPLSLPAGDYLVQVFGAISTPPALASARVDTAVITDTETVPSGKNVSLVANIEGGTPQLSAFVNNTSAVAEGTSLVTVRHTADAPAVDISVNGTVAIPNLAPGAEASAPLPAGTYDIQVLVAGTSTVALNLPGTVIPAGKSVIVYAIGDAGAQPSTLTAVVQVIDVATTPATTPTTAPAAAAGVTASPAMTG